MILYRTINEIRNNINNFRKNFPEGRVSLVPTMGFLHDGHLELIREARKISDLVVVSIFVNKLQFNDSADFEKYPKDESGDFKKCESGGADIIFAPSSEEMYGISAPLVNISIDELTDNLCGKYRPGHFEGVLSVIVKLFNIVKCDIAIFGKKDFQQYLVIKKMTEEFNFPVSIIGANTVRESDGLAMSSRNARLSEKARIQSALINRALRIVEKTIAEGGKNPDELMEIGRDVIESGSLNKVEYFDIVDSVNLQLLDTVKKMEDADHILVAAAVFCDGVRLIDNLEISR